MTNYKSHVPHFLFPCSRGNGGGGGERDGGYYKVGGGIYCKKTTTPKGGFIRERGRG